MGRMKYTIEENRDIYLGNTRVENLFINEYLPAASGDQVKVYIYGLMYAQNKQEMDIREQARVLNMTEADVIEAFEYWARRGLVRLKLEADDANKPKDFEKADFIVEFVSQVNTLYGMKLDKTRGTVSNESGQNNRVGTSKQQDEDEDIDSFDDDMSDDEMLWMQISKEIQGLYNEYEKATGRPISLEEMNKIEDLVKSGGVTADVLSYAISYCKEKEKFSIKYICGTAINWAKDGCVTIMDVKEREDRISKNREYYDQVFKQMGWYRPVMPDEMAMMDRWTGEMGFSIADVLAACKKSAGIREPNLKYVNGILENKYKEAGGVKVRKSNAANVNRQGKSNSKTNDTLGAGFGMKSATIPSNGYVSGNRDYSSNVSRKVLKEYYQHIRNKNIEEQQKRIATVCQRIPKITELLKFEEDMNRKALKFDFSPEGKANRQKAKEKKQMIEAAKRKLLSENGIAEDYMDLQYFCKECKDTGTLEDGRICACAKARAEEAYKWNKEKN
jgi:DnaD/phage-associated family protein